MTMDHAENVSVAEFVYASLRRSIQQGRYSPGARLTTMRLADELGVSRTPVRAALTRLMTEGLVVAADGRGARIPDLTAQSVQEAYEIAGALESMLVAQVAKAASDAQLATLAAVVDRMEAAAEAGDQAGWAEADEQFHELVRRYSDREVAVSMLTRVDAVIDRIRYLSLNLRPQGAEVSTREHRDVVEAILARDPDRARGLHEAHLRRVREETVSFLAHSFPAFGGTGFANHGP
jgi:GntR family transcriptional regulator, rspAB operon transcriptional repressor